MSSRYRGKLRYAAYFLTVSRLCAVCPFRGTFLCQGARIGSESRRSASASSSRRWIRRLDLLFERFISANATNTDIDSIFEQ